MRRRNNYKRNRGKRNGRRGNRRNDDRKVISAIRAIKNSPKSKSSDDKGDFTPEHSFDDFRISERLKLNISNKRYETPTPIQDKAIPKILTGNDIIGIANTGTGKTAAFLIPLIDKITKKKNQRVLIILPTRELAAQISDELFGFTYGMNVTWTVCVGGKNMVPQIDQLAKDPDIVIGTPGRMKDLSKKRFLDLKKFNNVVLDEADRMVDMGFINDIRYFINGLPKERQSLFFSATVPPKVETILKSFVRNAVKISVKSSNNIENISHKLIEVNGKKTKFQLLNDHLKKDDLEKVLIFGRTKRGVQQLTNNLKKRGYNTKAIHGNKNQNQRQKVLNDFRVDNIRILVATDVASRGIDVDDISHVINYDLPGTIEDYVHRVGRTGRANKKGTALTFINK